jgi:hypothetical protein
MILQTFAFPYFDLPTLLYFTDVSIQTPFIIGLEIFIIFGMVLFSSKAKIAKEVLDAATKIVAIAARGTLVYKNTKNDSGGSGGSGNSDSNKDNDKDNDKDKNKNSKDDKSKEEIKSS